MIKQKKKIAKFKEIPKVKKCGNKTKIKVKGVTYEFVEGYYRRPKKIGRIRKVVRGRERYKKKSN